MIPRDFGSSFLKVTPKPQKSSKYRFNFLDYLLGKDKQGRPIRLHREKDGLDQLNSPSICEISIGPGLGSCSDFVYQDLTIRGLKFGGQQWDA